jgi:uncharacterized membrane protein YozB (DUF420 family)
LGVLVVAFIGFSLPPYLTGDVTAARVVPPPGVPGYYPLLVSHVVSGSVALLAGLLQLWPWLRRRHPRVHRWTGRTYVFLGALPAGLTALPLAVTSPFGPVGRVSSTILASLWVGATLTGFVLARRRRFAEHRRWMIRSAALGLSIILNRVVGIAVFVVLSPQLASGFEDNDVWFMQTVAGITTWLSWTTVLLATEWWLERHRTPVPDFARDPAVRAR